MTTNQIVSDSLEKDKPVQVVDISESRLLLAEERDTRVRELERQHIANWSEMAFLCREVEEQEDWKYLGFESYNRWLLSAAPQSRSAMYAARGLLDELRGIETSDLREMPLGSAKVLASVPRCSRTPKLIAAAKRPPKEFKALVQDKFPDLHIENSSKRSFEFTRSQEKIVDEAIAMANVIESGEVTEEIAPETEMVVCICLDYRDRHRAIYDRIKKGK